MDQVDGPEVLTYHLVGLNNEKVIKSQASHRHDSLKRSHSDQILGELDHFPRIDSLRRKSPNA